MGRGYTCEGDLELSRNLGIHTRNRLCEIGYAHCFGFQTLSQVLGVNFFDSILVVDDVPGCLTFVDERWVYIVRVLWRIDQVESCCVCLHCNAM